MKIKTSQSELKFADGMAFYMLLWGILISLYFIAQHFQYGDYSESVKIISTFSWLLFPIGGLLSYFALKSDSGNDKYALTGEEKVAGITWMTVGFLTVVCMLLSPLFDDKYLIPSIASFFGMATFVIGLFLGLIHFMLFGTLATCVALAGMCFPIIYQFIIAGISVFISCVLPVLIGESFIEAGKRSYLMLVFFIGFSLNLSSQKKFNSCEKFANVNNMIFQLKESVKFNPGASGANAVWDFSKLKIK